MTTTTITALILIILALTIKVFKQGIRINDFEASEDWEDTDKHPFINGDCCRCEECVERFTKKLNKDLK